ncbi:C2H2 finger domain transcription factor mtfA [Mycena indigotica]|uniref:C2H2 finger domain transcription factor mtfA n=1 Tax=Mycena indigotica TaxID=2126181 RepID=A0A8H6S0V1_9AGAR|nr:C2H2 finger domain transcription factor mtfA [Mycena indigotica]KAF7290258.1 C2H2 finger domain transcription factor mtfA [Mycena indigotica]
MRHKYAVGAPFAPLFHTTRYCPCFKPRTLLVPAARGMVLHSQAYTRSFPPHLLPRRLQLATPAALALPQTFAIPASPLTSGTKSPRSSHSSQEDDQSEGEGDLPPLSDDEETRRHVCQICRRRFSRPSSLKTHQNTHSGATPYPCPFPGCGRQFNVKSNMRRHHRNHAAPAA